MTPTQVRAGVTAAAAVLGAVALLAMMTWAAAIGPDEVLDGPGLARHPESIRSGGAFADGLLSRHGTPVAGATPPAPGWLRAVGDLLYLVLALLAAVALWRLAARARRAWRSRRRRPHRETAQVAFESLDAHEVSAADLHAGAALAAAALDDGTPRNAIVACWHRFETTAEQAGVRRRRWQTSSEFVLEVLERAGADTAAVTRLAALYREARFSDHDLDEDARDSARAALAATRRSLRAAGDRAPAPTPTQASR